MQDNYKVGDFVENRRKFSKNDVLAFSKLSNDANPIHLDESFAKESFFQKPIVHGMLVGSMFSAIIANELPGPGSIYLSQSLQFMAPVYHDVEVIAKVTIISIREDKPIFELETVCTDSNGTELIRGTAVIKLLK